MREVNLTAEQGRTLSLYLSLTSHLRQGEVENWARLEQEKDRDGKAAWKNATGNKAFWQDLTDKIEEIIKILDGS